MDYGFYLVGDFDGVGCSAIYGRQGQCFTVHDEPSLSPVGGFIVDDVVNLIENGCVRHRERWRSIWENSAAVVSWLLACSEKSLLSPYKVPHGRAALVDGANEVRSFSIICSGSRASRARSALVAPAAAWTAAWSACTAAWAVSLVVTIWLTRCPEMTPSVQLPGVAVFLRLALFSAAASRATTARACCSIAASRSMLACSSNAWCSSARRDRC